MDKSTSTVWLNGIQANSSTHFGMLFDVSENITERAAVDAYVSGWIKRYIERYKYRHMQTIYKCAVTRDDANAYT